MRRWTIVAVALGGLFVGYLAGHSRGASSARAATESEWEDVCDDMLRRCRREAEEERSSLASRLSDCEAQH
jgi:hypothetical protein